MGIYSEDPGWADIGPIPQDEGGSNPLAAINYSDEYTEAMGYLRAVMAKNETSPRALALTEDIIDMNPAHYTIWLYRAEILFAIKADLRQELNWLNETALKHQKNYQIWNHRQTIVDRVNSADGEIEFISRMFEKDAKNYHVWSYRHWLVRRFDLWGQGELEAVELLLKDDIRNNSAWNHRWFIVFGRENGEVASDIVQRELAFAENAIRLAPQNQSPWSYLKGVVRRSGKPISEVKGFASEFASLEEPEKIRSSHALDLLAEIYGQEARQQEAATALDLLAKHYDPIRANYWNYRKALLT
ncbi:MAG: CAAX geranylgeranyltransferase alpha subunit [Bogoriella megaspora]|nr:MAG: CAAX geranylgeranyltransferase alpha subunit [Bogoriella megaspora]